MIKILIVSFCVLFISSCTTTGKEDLSEKSKNEIIETEKAFSEMSVQKGMFEAFLFYASDDVVKLTNRQHPIKGLQELRKSFEGQEDTSFTLKWYPVKAEAASSGEFGYTYGNWEYIGPDSLGNDMTLYGNYFTVWKKDKNGKWKFALDGGNTTPPPLNNERL